MYDLSDQPEAVISYWRWYNNSTGADPGNDVFIVEISNNGGSSWTNLETVGPNGPGTTGGWIFHEARVADFVTPTANVRLRFIASDENAGSIVEAGIDDLRIDSLGCEDSGGGGDCPGDADGDGSVDLNDINLVLGSFNQSVTPGTNGDTTGDGVVNLDDLNDVLANFNTSCP